MTTNTEVTAVPLLLQDLSEKVIENIKANSTVFTYQHGDSRPCFSSMPGHFLFVEEGWLMLKIENKVVGMLTKGDIVMLLDSDEVASYRLRAYLEPITEGRALLIKKTAVLTALHDRADIMFSLYAKLSARIAREYRRSYNFYNTKLELVLLEFFSKVGVTAPNGRYYLPKLTQTEIAGCLGVRREDVSRRRQDLIQMNAILQDEQGKWYIGPAGLELLK